jgi:hypothetical protein
MFFLSRRNRNWDNASSLASLCKDFKEAGMARRDFQKGGRNSEHGQATLF